MDLSLIETVRNLAALSDPESQVQRLRRIKNDTVGHSLRKELVITNGLLANLEHVLAVNAKASGKQSEGAQWSIEDEVRLQATLVLETLANGGPSFVSPILLSNAMVHLFGALAPVEVPSRIVIASLRALNSLAASWTLTELSPPTTTPSPLALQAFSRTNSARINQLLRSSVTSAEGRQYIDLAAGLIATACTDDLSRAALTKAGSLEILASILADFALHDSKQYGSYKPPQTAHLPLSTVSKILDAISTIIRNSNYRCYRLLLASSFRRMFSSSSSQSLGSTTGVDVVTAAYAARSEGCIMTDSLLPKILTPVNKIVNFGSQQFPSLQSIGGRAAGDSIFGSPAHCDPLCAWLIHMARRFETPTGKLAALRLLALEIGSLDLDPQTPTPSGKSRGRERQLALLAVPIAVKLVQDAYTSFNASTPADMETKVLQEEACSVLSLLIQTSLELQRTAVEAGAIKYVSQMLKKSFDPVAIARPMWSAQHLDELPHSNVPSAQMGESILPPEIAHVMKIRAGALRALASINQREDGHRKVVIDQGMVNYLIDSLVPVAESSLLNLSSASVTCNFNTVSVIVAACEAARSMARSVSLLRTSLIDAGIAKPILSLLQHTDTDVVIAATNVCCNLALDFSPMRQPIMEAGAIEILSDHARRSSPALRMSSLWALKHLIMNAPKDIKVAVLDELGPGWLVQAISGDSRSDLPSSAPGGMSTSNAAGEQVNILNAPETPDMELCTPDEILPDDEAENGYQASAIRSTLKPNLLALSTLRILRERETSQVLKARQENIDIQEQALDFVRNLITGDDSAGMIDHLDRAIGLQRLFELLIAKLESPPSTLSRSTSSTISQSLNMVPGIPRQESGTSSTPDVIVHSVVHILTHMSAASARHKQLLIAQKPLLRAWAPHFSHSDPFIRTICVWTVINLTWIDDQSDREDARRRAVELRAFGIEEKVRQMQNDSVLDIRERCKTAVRQLDELLTGSTSRTR